MIRALERDPILKRNRVVIPQSLDELRERCGVWGNLAVARAEWSSVTEWAREREKNQPKAMNSAGLTEAVGLYSHMLAVQRGDPTLSGGADVSKLASASAHIKRTRAAHALWAKSEWEKASRPHLSGSMMSVLRYFYECERQALLRENGQ